MLALFARSGVFAKDEVPLNGEVLLVSPLSSSLAPAGVFVWSVMVVLDAQTRGLAALTLFELRRSDEVRWGLVRVRVYVPP